MYILMILYALPVHFLHQLLFTGFFFQIRPPLICLKLRHCAHVCIHNVFEQPGQVACVCLYLSISIRERGRDISNNE
jgi:hypothetical protein